MIKADTVTLCKKMNYVFIIVFIVFISLPNIYLSKEKTSVTENRTLATYKPLIVENKINFSYGKNFEAFYNDRFFMRNLFVKANQKIFSRFYSNFNDVVFMGENDWSFYRGDDSDLNFANVKYFTDDELKLALFNLLKIQKWCDENGKTFIYFIAPDKNKIYGEYYPKTIVKKNPDTKSRAFQLIDYIRNNSNIKVVYPYQELITEKQKDKLLYYKNDTHWTPLGAYIGYKTLCSSIGIDETKITGFSEQLNEKGDLNSMFLEKMKPDLKTMYSIPIIDKNFIQIEYSDFGQGTANIVHTDNNSKNSSNKSVFMLRDSFSTSLIPFIASSFKSADFYWRFHFVEEDEAKLINADFVIYENVERLIPSILEITFPSFME